MLIMGVIFMAFCIYFLVVSAIQIRLLMKEMKVLRGAAGHLHGSDEIFYQHITEADAITETFDRFTRRFAFWYRLSKWL